MATFSNPAGQAQSTGSAYTKLLLDTLGDRDPLTVQESTPAKLQAAIAGLDGATLRRAEKPGKWSILEVLQHLADSELVGGYRMRMIVSHPTPDIQVFDQDLWAKELDYKSADPHEALDDFRTQRAANVRLIRSFSAEKLERFGHHSERGKESVAKMLKLYAGHDLLHLKQIERIKAAVKGKK